jgi:hypothetical protein
MPAAFAANKAVYDEVRKTTADQIPQLPDIFNQLYHGASTDDDFKAANEAKVNCL